MGRAFTSGTGHGNFVKTPCPHQFGRGKMEESRRCLPMSRQARENVWRDERKIGSKRVIFGRETRLLHTDVRAESLVQASLVNGFSRVDCLRVQAAGSGG